jgi:hypothetical protein
MADNYDEIINWLFGEIAIDDNLKQKMYNAIQKEDFKELHHLGYQINYQNQENIFN